ncbi:MAG: MaoC/PaaZ C-terminal domain-containing protein [Thermoplasmata archaeon]
MCGKFFEDFELGERYRSPGRTVTETDIVTFAMLSGDWNSIHVDDVYAQDSLFGKRVAHGLLLLSIMSGMWVRLGVFEGSVIAFYGIDRLRFTKPVFSGDTIHLEMEIKEKREKDEKGGILVCNNNIINQKGDIVLVCDTLLLIKKKRPNS